MIEPGGIRIPGASIHDIVGETEGVNRMEGRELETGTLDMTERNGESGEAIEEMVMSDKEETWWMKGKIGMPVRGKVGRVAVVRARVLPRERAWTLR